MDFTINITTENTGTGAGDERLRQEILKRIAETLEAEYGCGCDWVRKHTSFREDFQVSSCEVPHREDDYDGEQVLEVRFA